MVTREKNGDGEIRGKAIEARRGEAARASAAVARVGRAPDGAARARAWIRRGEGVERAQLRVRVPRGANRVTDRAERRFGRRKKSCQVRVQFTVHVHSCTRTQSSPDASSSSVSRRAAAAGMADVALGEPTHVPATPPPVFELADVWTTRVDKRACSLLVRARRPSVHPSVRSRTAVVFFLALDAVRRPSRALSPTRRRPLLRHLSLVASVAAQGGVRGDPSPRRPRARQARAQGGRRRRPPPPRRVHRVLLLLLLLLRRRPRRPGRGARARDAPRAAPARARCRPRARPAHERAVGGWGTGAIASEGGRTASRDIARHSK